MVVATEGLLKDRRVERVDRNPSSEFGLPFECTVTLRLQETIQLLLGIAVIVNNEPDRCHRVNKQPSRTFTKEVHLFSGWPVAQTTSVALEF